MDCVKLVNKMSINYYSEPKETAKVRVIQRWP